MSEKLRKDEAMPLPQQISSIIRTRIAAGKYLPGKRLGTIRQFAKDFSVSTVTVVKALDILEKETLIERVPVKGVFVSEHPNTKKKTLSACFAFPEKELTRDACGDESWGLDIELYRGLLAGAKLCGISLQFAYFEDNPSPRLLKKQLEVLRDFDFVVFPGSNQLQDLRTLSSAERLTFFLARKYEVNNSPAIAVDYDRDDMRKSLRELLVSSGRKSAAVISGTGMDGVRAKQFLEDAKAAGIETPPAPLLFGMDDPDITEKLRAFLLKRSAGFILVDFPEFMLPLYEAAFDAGLVPGKDFIPTSVASGMIFTGLLPRLSYFRIPRYEMGIRIMEKADRVLRKGEKPEITVLPKLKFIDGTRRERSVKIGRPAAQTAEYAVPV